MSVNWLKTITTTIANINQFAKIIGDNSTRTYNIQLTMTIHDVVKTFRILDWFELAALYNQKVMLNADEDEEGKCSRGIIFILWYFMWWGKKTFSCQQMWAMGEHWTVVYIIIQTTNQIISCFELNGDCQKFNKMFENAFFWFFRFFFVFFLHFWNVINWWNCGCSRCRSLI